MLTPLIGLRMAGKKATSIPDAEVERLSEEFLRTLMRHDMVRAKLLAVAISKMPRNGFKIFRVIAQQIVRDTWNFNKLIQEIFNTRYWTMDTNVIGVLLFDKFIQMLKFLVDRGMIPVKKILTFNTLNVHFLVGSPETFRYAFESGFIHFGKSFELKKASGERGIVSSLAAQNLYFLNNSSAVYSDLIQKFGLNPEYFVDQSRLYMSRMHGLIHNFLYLIEVFKDNNNYVCNQILTYVIDEFIAIEEYASRYNPVSGSRDYPMTNLHLNLSLPSMNYLNGKTAFNSLKAQSQEVSAMIPTVVEAINLYNPTVDTDAVDLFDPGSIGIYRKDAVTS